MSRGRSPSDIGYNRGMDERARKRAAARGQWPIVKTRLADESSGELVKHGTPSECVAMVWRLTRDAWAFSGRAIPSYGKADMPGKISRGRGVR